MNQYWYSLINWSPCLDFLSFYLMYFSCSTFSFRIYIKLSCLLRLLLAVTVFHTFFSFLVILTALRIAGLLYYRRSLSWDLSNVFLMSRLILRILERKTREVKCHVILRSTCYHCDLLLTLIIWLGFSNINYSLSFHSVHRKKIARHTNLHLSGELYATSLRVTWVY